MKVRESFKNKEKLLVLLIIINVHIYLHKMRSNISLGQL